MREILGVLEGFPWYFRKDQGKEGEGTVKPSQIHLVQKNPRVRKIFVRNSGAGNGCANFMDAWKNASVLQEKPCP